MNIQVKEILYLLFIRVPFYILGKYRKNHVKVHWGRGLHNFGDCLQPSTLKHYGLTPYYVTSMEKADVIMAGSILQWLSPSYEGYIIGTGGDDRKYNFPSAKVLALRGSKTLHNFSKKSSCILGDTGLIMPYVFPNVEEKKYDLGVIPHFVDEYNEKFLRLASFPKVKIINVLQSPEKVIKQIKQCKYIASSSLHGLIIADAYHIPNIRIVDYDTFAYPACNYKFEDYYSALGLEYNPFVMRGNERKDQLIALATVKPVEKIEKIQKALDEVMRQFAHIIKQRQR